MSLCPLSSSLLQLSFLFSRMTYSCLRLFGPRSFRDGTGHLNMSFSLSIMVIILSNDSVCLFCRLNHIAICMWLKFLCLDFCLCPLENFIAINHFTVCHYLIAFSVWYHDGVFQCIDIRYWWSHWTEPFRNAC